MRPNLLIIAPGKWSSRLVEHAKSGAANVIVHGQDNYRPESIDYVLSFRPPPGLLKSLPNLKAVFSLGAGVDGFLLGGDYPQSIPLVRFVDASLSAEMTQFVLMHVLIHHRCQRLFDDGQRRREWRQMLLPRRTEDTRVGLLGLGEIGSMVSSRLGELGFQVSSWTRSRKSIPNLKSFAGDGELASFLGQADIVVCLLALTKETTGILNARAFAAMPKGGFVINVARGGHLVENDLVEALDSSHLSGAVLDVFETEPLPQTSPLWTHPKVTVTPHIAAISQPQVAAQYVLGGIAKFERGEKPENIVDVSRGY